MTKAVLHFEDNEKVAEKFRLLLEKQGLVFHGNNDLLWKYIYYLTPNDDLNSTPRIRLRSDVAKEAFEWIGGNKPERVVFVTDLRSEGGYSPKYKKYGLEVLQELANLLGQNQNTWPYILNFEDLVDNKNILIVFLTLFPDDLISSLNITNQKISIISPKDDDRQNLSPSQALLKIQSSKSRIVCADRGVHGNWLSELIALWIRQPA